MSQILQGPSVTVVEREDRDVAELDIMVEDNWYCGVQHQSRKEVVK
jgi:hypothetical protein